MMTQREDDLILSYFTSPRRQINYAGIVLTTTDLGIFIPHKDIVEQQIGVNIDTSTFLAD